jgi:type IV pilus assembly protein PilQ
MRQGFRMLTLLALTLSAEAALADSPRTRLEQIEVRANGERADVVLGGNVRAARYAVRALNGGDQLVIDVAGASLGDRDGVALAKQPLVENASATETADGVRLELTLKQHVTYRARNQGDSLVISLERLEEAASTVMAARGVGTAVERITLEKRAERERVVIDLSGPAEFRILAGGKGPARMELKQADLAPSLVEPVLEDKFALLKGVHFKRESGRVMIEVERADNTQATAIREGNRIVWMFAPPVQATGGTPKSRVMVAAVEPVELDSEEAASFVSGSLFQSKSVGGQKYTGRRIDLDFKDADIHNILRLLSEVGGVNVVTSDDVSGAVTIRMRDVPWDQALDVILQAKGLGAERRGNLVRVAPQEVLEKERELAIARQKQQIELAPLETRLVPVSYATAKDVQPRVQELMSPRGTVSVDERTNVLIVRDIIDNLEDAEELVRTLDTQTPQVLIEARIVEANSTYVRDVGIQWGGDVSLNQAFGNQTGLVFPSNIGIAGGAYDTTATPTQGLSPLAAQTTVPNFAVNLPAAAGAGAGGALGLTFGSVDGNYNLNVRLSAAESTGAIKLISSPRVLTLDNHAARISQGTQIPYSQVSAQGVQTAFQTAVLELNVTPHVTADGAVSMKVNVTRNEPDFSRTGANGQPTILKREAQTELLISDGHTAVIGGIYTRNSTRTVDQVPLLGDIPILGLLFQRRRNSDNRNELLIFLTPRIVNREQAMMSSASQQPPAAP